MVDDRVVLKVLGGWSKNHLEYASISTSLRSSDDDSRRTAETSVNIHPQTIFRYEALVEVCQKDLQFYSYIKPNAILRLRCYPKVWKPT